MVGGALKYLYRLEQDRERVAWPRGPEAMALEANSPHRSRRFRGWGWGRGCGPKAGIRAEDEKEFREGPEKEGL